MTVASSPSGTEAVKEDLDRDQDDRAARRRRPCSLLACERFVVLLLPLASDAEEAEGDDVLEVRGELLQLARDNDELVLDVKIDVFLSLLLLCMWKGSVSEADADEGGVVPMISFIIIVDAVVVAR